MGDKEKLIEKRKMLNEQLNKADASGNMFLCMNIGNALNTIDEKLRKMGVDDELERMGIEEGDIVRIMDYEFEYTK